MALRKLYFYPQVSCFPSKPTPDVELQWEGWVSAFSHTVLAFQGPSTRYSRETKGGTSRKTQLTEWTLASTSIPSPYPPEVIIRRGFWILFSFQDINPQGGEEQWDFDSWKATGWERNNRACPRQPWRELRSNLVHVQARGQVAPGHPLERSHVGPGLSMAAAQSWLWQALRKSTSERERSLACALSLSFCLSNLLFF